MADKSAGIAARQDGAPKAGKQRERFGTQLGFLLVSAGCAVGLGNVWRFPYICGKYGGGAFVAMYIVFLCILGLPILAMEFAAGRESRKSIARSYNVLERPGTKWHLAKWPALAGNYLLMMFYTVVAGWMVAYMVKSATGQLMGLDADGVAAVFSNLLANPVELMVYMTIVVVIGVLSTMGGVQKGLERVTKVMMSLLLIILVVLVIRALLLPGAAEGLQFYLVPDFGKLLGSGIAGTWEAVFAAMSHAFFTLSIGIGSMLVFGSYLDNKKTIGGEAVRVGGLDTAIAIMSGLVIFPACFTFGIEPGSGPGLVFVTLPNVFDKMPLGQLWCTLFFLFMSSAALSTVTAVFENIMSFSIDEWDMPRKKACCVNGVFLFVLSIPCVLGFNVLSGFTIPGIGDIQSIEDFLVSNIFLPLGGLVLLLFCTHKSGWGFDGFLKQANKGEGLKFPAWLRGYLTYVLPILIIVVFIGGLMPVVQAWLGMA